ncbi:MAG: DUF2721 domain-containing protein [Sphingomicrobium sp.]
MIITGLPNFSTTNTEVAQVIQSAVAPVFLLAGIGAFLNVCVQRLARIVDRSRNLEPKLLGSRGREHDRIIDELRSLDRRIRVVNAAVLLSVSAAVLICLVVIMLFAGQLAGLHVGTPIALLFIAAMISTAGGFAVFLYETRLGTTAVRIRNELLEHEAEPIVAD